MPTLKGFLFDLDGVIADTTEMHFQAWCSVADTLGTELGKEAYRKLKGLSGEACLNHLLTQAGRKVSSAEKTGLLAQKDRSFSKLGPPTTVAGAKEFLMASAALNLKLAVGSASRNAKRTLAQLQLDHFFEVIIDGRSTSKSKPDPQVFEMAAQALELKPAEMVVFEDSSTGIEAALNGGFRTVGIGRKKVLKKAEFVYPDLRKLTPAALINKLNL